MRYLMFFMVMMLANVAHAMDCEKVPTCEELGYSTEEDPNCAENGYMYCPFDKTYKKCVNMDCEKLGFTTSDKTSWCGKIVSCRADKNFTACKALCEVGDVYYSDGTCGYVEDYDSNGSKTPVGVVYYVTDDGRHGKVINLHDLGRASSSASFVPTNPYNTTHKTFTWGVYDIDISGLTNWTCGGNNYLIVAKTGDHNNPFWSAGKEYTQIIAKAQSSNLQYAAPATLAFYPPEVSENDPKVGKGKWYLPTLGELMDLYGYDYNNVANDVNKCESSTGANGSTKKKVNATLAALKSKSAGNAEELTEDYYWSSLEYAGDHSWKLHLDNGNRFANDKNVYNYVRASLAF